MSSWDHCSPADEHTSYTMSQGVEQSSPIESTYTDGCIYPDPTGFGTQTLPDDAETLPKSPHHCGPYFQASDSRAKEVEPVDPFVEDEYWSKQSWDPDQEQYLADLDPFPEETLYSGIQGDSRSQGQLSTATMEQTREDIPHIFSSSREANLPMETANTVASGNIYSAGYPFDYAQQNISYQSHHRGPGSIFGYARPNVSYPANYFGSSLGQQPRSIYTVQEQIPHNASSSREAYLPIEAASAISSGNIYPVGYPIRGAPRDDTYPNYFAGIPLEQPSNSILSDSYSLDEPLEERIGSLLSNPHSPGRAFGQRSQDFLSHESPYASIPRSPSSPKKRKRTDCAQQTSRSKRSRTAYTTQGEHETTSALARNRARLGASMGSDRRRRAETRVENGVLFGLVDNEWKPAGYHLDFRMRLILRDAQQPGAPVPPMFQQGIPPNYTSYSPITQGWNDDDLRSMRDSQGRHAFLMPTPPPDWQHNPPSAYLMYNGLVMLDQNNRPVKEYPGAPLTLSYDAPASLVEGLRRYFGMTYSDMTGRMPPERHTPTGIKPIIGITLLSTRVKRWYDDHKGTGLGPWHDRKKR